MKLLPRAMVGLFISAAIFGFGASAFADDALPESKSAACSAALRSTAGLERIFKEIQFRLKRETRHPDLVLQTELEDLPLGTTYYLEPKFFKNFRPPGLNAGDFTKAYYAVKVLESEKAYLRLANAELGELVFEGHDLVWLANRLYSRRDFMRRSIYSPGEFVQVGSLQEKTAGKAVRLEDIVTGISVYLDAARMPLPARFVKAVSLDRYQVEFENFNGQGSLLVEVPKKLVSPTPTGTEERARIALSALDGIKPRFRLNERVRLIERGHMRTGTVAELRPSEIVFEDGRVMPISQVFKMWTKGTPRTWGLDGRLYGADSSDERVSLEVPTGLLRVYLTAAAKLSGHVEFQSASLERRLNLLLQFQHLFMPWTVAGANLEFAGITDLSDLLCAGVGVCRHNTPLMMAVLGEAGVEARIYMHSSKVDPEKPENSGHTWLQVTSIEENKEFVVDPSSVVVKELWLSEAMADLVPDSADGKWWANPWRTRVPLQDLSDE